MDQRCRLSNDILNAVWGKDDSKLKLIEFRSRLNQSEAVLNGGELFELVLKGGLVVRASDLVIQGGITFDKLQGDAQGIRLVDRENGWRLNVILESPDGKTRVIWHATLRDESNYIVQEIKVQALPGGEQPTAIRQLRLKLPEARVEEGDRGALAMGVDKVIVQENSKFSNDKWPWTTPVGMLRGLPVTGANMFFGIEHPWSVSQVKDGQMVIELNGEAGQGQPQTAVMGVAPAGQMRRAFLYYINRERAFPHRPFLVYNNWWTEALDGGSVGEVAVLGSIRFWNEHFISPFQAKLDAVLLDDSWQDRVELGRSNRYVPNPQLPNGFKVIGEETRKQHTGLGIWFYPGATLDQAKPELNAFFEQQCIKMMKEDNVKIFKFDGVNTRLANVTGAYLQILSHLRQAKPDIFIKSTNGTYPSPWWLWYADTSWRGGGDFPTRPAPTEGPLRQQWITARDATVYRNVYKMSPLYPLSALMTHGVVNTWRSAWANDTEFTNNRAEIMMYFGSGVGLQDLYITLSIYKNQTRKFLADVAQWARVNADVLIDSHWIGGDPAAGEVYGYASWSPGKAFITLRNPSAHPVSYPLDLKASLNLPQGASENYTLKELFPENDVRPIEMNAAAGHSVSIDLPPLAVRIIELTPPK